jgi:hypothetical protein
MHLYFIVSVEENYYTAILYDDMCIFSVIYKFQRVRNDSLAFPPPCVLHSYVPIP